MPFLLVRFNDLPHLLIQPGMKLRQAHGDILVHRGFGDAESGGGAADGRAVLGDVAAETQGAVIQCIGPDPGGTELLVSQKASLPMRNPLTGGLLPASTYAAGIGNMPKGEKTALCMITIFTKQLAVS